MLGLREWRAGVRLQQGDRRVGCGDGGRKKKEKRGGFGKGTTTGGFSRLLISLLNNKNNNFNFNFKKLRVKTIF